MTTKPDSEFLAGLELRFAKASGGDRMYERPMSWDDAERLLKLALSTPHITPHGIGVKGLAAALEQYDNAVERNAWRPNEVEQISGVYTAAAKLASTVRSALQRNPEGDAPRFEGIAKVKLDALLKQGWEISGYSIKNRDRHGFVTTDAFVGWWLPEYYPNHTSSAIQRGR